MRMANTVDFASLPCMKREREAKYSACKYQQVHYLKRGEINCIHCAKILASTYVHATIDNRVIIMDLWRNL